MTLPAFEDNHARVEFLRGLKPNIRAAFDRYKRTEKNGRGMTDSEAYAAAVAECEATVPAVCEPKVQAAPTLHHFAVGQRVELEYKLRMGNVTMQGEVVKVYRDGYADVLFEPDGYWHSKPHKMTLSPSDKNLRIVEQGEQQVLFGGGA